MRGAAIPIVLLLAAAWARPVGAQAPEPPNEVDLGEVIRMARSSANPRVRAIAVRARTARAELVEASVHPNPSLSYTFTGPLRGPNTLDGSQHFVGLDQPILLSGQRAARQRAAERRVQAAEARADAELMSLVRDARHLYVNLLLAQKSLQIKQRSLETLERVRRIVETRSTLRGSSRYDALRLDVEQSALGAELERQRAEIEDAGARLGALLGRPGWSPRARGKLDPGRSALPPAVAVHALQRSNPELVAALREASAAESEIDAANRDAWPVPTLGIGALMTTEPRSIAGVVGVTIPLPAFDRAQGARSRARAEAAAAEAEQRAVRAEIVAEAQRAARQLALKKATLERLDRSALARLPALTAMAEDAYREGVGGVVALLDASSAERDLLLDRASLAAEVMHAEIDVLALTGAILDDSGRWGGALRR